MNKAFHFTKKDEINSVSAIPLQKVKNQILTVTGAAITTRIDEETGEEREVGLISAEEGTFSSISGTAIKGLDLIIDYMTDLAGESDAAVSVQVKVNVGKSNAGREFITLELI